MKTKTTYSIHPRYMPRKGYKIAETAEIEVDNYIPGMSKLAGNKSASKKETQLTNEQLGRIRILLKFGLKLPELAHIFGVQENIIKFYLSE